MNFIFHGATTVIGTPHHNFSFEKGSMVLGSPALNSEPTPPGKSSNEPVPAAEATSDQEQLPKDSPSLTLRRPDEILEMHFDDDDLYVANGILAKGQPSTLIGQGGTGKSRFITQLAASTILGKQFLGWEVTKKPLRWLILQAENSNRRLRHDLARIRLRTNEEEWNQIQTNLIVHTLEKDHDTFLSVGNPTSAELLAQAIKRAHADVVVFDPLYAFATGNLNSDSAMIKTCQSLRELAKLGNPDAAIVVIHHSLSGKEGAKKATGLDRTSFGRNSKALQFWTRGQINIAPVSTETNERLVVSCGKNSNGPEFQPFGIRLNLETMAYQVDPDFNLENWKAGVSDQDDLKQLSKAEQVADLVSSLPVTKKDLTIRVMEEFGCSRSSAYSWIKEAEGKTIRRNSTKRYEAFDAMKSE